MLRLNSFRDTPYNLQFIFAGEAFEWQSNSSFIPGTKYYQIKTPPGKIMHITNRIILTQSTGITYQFRKNPVISVQGTSAQAIFNLNRNINSTAQTKIYTNPSATSGTILENITLISGNAFVQQSPELILRSNSDYVIRVTNSGGVNATVNFAFAWYESNN